jgi:hypothetical protein
VISIVVGVLTRCLLNLGKGPALRPAFAKLKRAQRNSSISPRNSRFDVIGDHGLGALGLIE